LAVLSFDWGDLRFNLLDTPGYADFVGEVVEAMRVVDAAALLFEAQGTVETGAEQAWRLAEEQGLAMLAVVSKMDRENANFQRILDQIQARFGARVLPIQLPIGSESSYAGHVDLISMKAYRGADGTPSDVPVDLRESAEAARERLVEAAAETDDDLITKYLEGEPLTEAEVRRGVRAGCVGGTIVPVVCIASLSGVGVKALLQVIADYLPSPRDRPAVSAINSQTDKQEVLKPADSEPLSALVFKTAADPFVGKLTYFRVFSGVLHSDSIVWNASKGREERLAQLFAVRARTQEPVVQLGAGDIGAVAKLQDTATGDTLSSRDKPVVLAAMSFPLAVFSSAVSPKTKADLDKLGAGINRLVDEDPTLQLRKDIDTNEMVLSGLGESHLDVTAEKLKRKFGVDVVLTLPKVPYKETITISVKAEHKHKKQTGGHGQYGHVLIALEPLERGAGFEFAEKVVGGSVPRNFIPAVEKGVREVLPEGAIAGFPVVDLRVTLYDGSYHAVDSSEMAFKVAAAQAFRKGCEAARTVLLEPITTISITVPDQYVGDVMGDLNTRRGRVIGITPQGGSSLVEATVPQAEVQRYATDLRSLTQGRGTFKLEFSHFEEVPAHIAQNVIAAAKKEKAEAK
jgi:elongation factor G